MSHRVAVGIFIAGQIAGITMIVIGGVLIAVGAAE